MSEILSEQQIKALQVLSRGGTYEQASKAAQCGIRTVFRWKKLPEFQARLRGFAETRMETVEELIKQQECIRIEDLVPQALERIQQILRDSSSRNADAIKAAELIGKWVGLDQHQEKEKQDPQTTLKNYLEYLAARPDAENS